MQLSVQWLNSWIKTTGTFENLANKLAVAGLEVDAPEVVGDDVHFALDLTPNRGDCLSLLGVAREVGVLLQKKPQAWSPKKIAPTIETTRQIKVGGACPYYLGCVIEGIQISAKTPDFIKEKLEIAGVGLNHPVVDILNYVMLSCGQPMHAFDLEKLAGNIVVRDSQKKEKIDLLDGNTITLDAGHTVIADSKGPVALAGIMGGAESAVSETTQHLFLECAWFEPARIATSARAYGFSTDASRRYERGVDTHLAERALHWAIDLIQTHCGGAMGPVTTGGSLPAPADAIVLRHRRIADLLGLSVDKATVESVLTALGCTCEATPEGWSVVPPTWRLDITLEADLIEEVGRVVGYEQLPQMRLHGAFAHPKVSEARVRDARIMHCLIDRGYLETITYSFVSPELEAWSNPDAEPLRLKNPISQNLSCMRTQVWPSLVSAWQHNRDRQCTHLKLFEQGHRYHTKGQETVIAGLWAGRVTPVYWDAPQRDLDFFDVKGDVAALLALYHVVVDWVPAAHPALHPGQSAAICVDGQTIGLVGALHPAIQQQLDLTEPVFIFECHLDLVTEIVEVSSVSKYPSIRRDLALLVPRDCTVGDIKKTIAKAAKPYLQEAFVFDVYAGKGVPDDQKSVAMGLILQHHSRTLTEAEVSDCMDKVVDCLRKAHQASLRE